MFEKSSLKKIGESDGGKLKILKFSGIIVTPIGIPIIVVTMIPINNAPFTFLASIIPVITKPIIVSKARLDVTDPIETRVAGLSVIIPPP